MVVLESLEVIDLKRLVFHEETEKSRYQKIMFEIQSSMTLCSPPIATKISGDKYLLLDGAHRVKAIEKLGYKNVIIQNVSLDNLELEIWKHKIDDVESVIDDLRSSKLFQFKSKHFDNAVASIRTTTNLVYLVPVKSSGSCEDVADFWRVIVEKYNDKQSIVRCSEDQGPGTISFKKLSLNEVVQIVELNKMFPTGVTKFKFLNGRLLNVNIPIACLEDNVQAKRMFSEYLESKKHLIRKYEDPIYLLEG